MNKLLVISLGVLALTAFVVAQDETGGEQPPNPPDRPDLREKFEEIIGDVSSTPGWFQEVIDKAREKLEEDPEEPPRRRRPHRGDPLGMLTDEDLEGIEGIPEWFMEIRELKQNRPRPPFRGVNRPKPELPEGVEEWFKTWLEEVRERRQQLHDARHAEREDGDGERQKGPRGRPGRRPRGQRRPQ